MSDSEDPRHTHMSDYMGRCMVCGASKETIRLERRDDEFLAVMANLTGAIRELRVVLMERIEKP